MFDEDGLRQGICASEIFLDEGLVDDSDRNAASDVLVGEGAAAVYADAEGFEVVRRAGFE